MTIQTHIILPSSSSSSSSSIITYQHQFEHRIQHDGIARAAPSQRLKAGWGTVVGSGYRPGTQTAWTGNIQWGVEVKALEVERGQSLRAKGNRTAARQPKWHVPEACSSPSVKRLSQGQVRIGQIQLCGSQVTVKASQQVEVESSNRRVTREVRTRCQGLLARSTSFSTSTSHLHVANIDSPMLLTSIGCHVGNVLGAALLVLYPCWLIPLFNKGFCLLGWKEGFKCPKHTPSAETANDHHKNVLYNTTLRWRPTTLSSGHLTAEQDEKDAWGNRHGGDGRSSLPVLEGLQGHQRFRAQKNLQLACLGNLIFDAKSQGLPGCAGDFWRNLELHKVLSIVSGRF
ncbi:hypothetical protein BKA70DRAFT_1243220 [Coprinopsis sp. MPI-PUGE-AT-0042]|nr:hypothetical protein BKA70DRAFT_1243220 [Coprinopsis sp. MPI-PUGE-AT-0042]